jgi:hypothetical protein
MKIGIKREGERMDDERKDKNENSKNKLKVIK